MCPLQFIQITQRKCQSRVMLKTLHCTFVFASVPVQPGNDTSFVSRSSLEFGKKPKTKNKFNIVCLWVFNLFPFQLFSHTCSRHLKVSLSLSLSLTLSLLFFPTGYISSCLPGEGGEVASRYPNTADALSFSSATPLFPAPPRL